MVSSEKIIQASGKKRTEKGGGCVRRTQREKRRIPRGQILFKYSIQIFIQANEKLGEFSFKRKSSGYTPQRND